MYDLRANMPQFGKRTGFNAGHLAEFTEAVGGDLTRVDEEARRAFITGHADGVDGCRLRCFSREEIAAKEDSLDLAWIRDDDAEDAADLPEPEVLIGEALAEMAGAMGELEAILLELGEEAAVATGH